MIDFPHFPVNSPAPTPRDPVRDLHPRPIPRSHPYFIHDEMFIMTGGRPREFQRLFREVWEMPYVVVPTPCSSTSGLTPTFKSS